MNKSRLRECFYQRSPVPVLRRQQRWGAQDRLQELDGAALQVGVVVKILKKSFLSFSQYITDAFERIGCVIVTVPLRALPPSA